MKKIISILLLIALIFSLSGCKKENEENKATISSESETNFEVVLGEKFTDFEGIDYSITKVILDGEDSKIYTEFVNNTEYTVIYNPNYSIEYFENENWVSCLKNDARDEEIAEHTVLAGRTIRYINLFYKSYDLSKQGKYRIIIDCDVYKNGIKDDGQKCSAFAEFTLGE